MFFSPETGGVRMFNTMLGKEHDVSNGNLRTSFSHRKIGPEQLGYRTE